MWYDVLVAEDIRNTDLFGALFLGLVAALFGIDAKLKTEAELETVGWLKFATILCVITAVLLVVRIGALTVVFFYVLLHH